MNETSREASWKSAVAHLGGVSNLRSLFFLAAAGAVVSATACSNADVAGIGAWGKPALVEKFSGGVLVYAGISTGKVQNEPNSDGYYFADGCSGGTLTEASGDVLITRPDTMPTCAAVLAQVKGPTF